MNPAFDSLAMPLAALLAVLLDRGLGELKRGHPLVAFGRLAGLLERQLNQGRRLPGLLAWLLAVAPWIFVASLLHLLALFVVDVLLLYFALGARSLAEHADAVVRPLRAGDLAEARQQVGYLVSRDTTQLDAPGVARAGVESVLENGNDAVFGTLFWFALLGGPGALLFRLANTLDAMWGYRSERFQAFGWAAARIDDLLNWLPARLTALTYALLGQTRLALRCWRSQAPHWDSPNAGPVMAAGAGSLGIEIGGPASYHGAVENRPLLGSGPAPQAGDIDRAVLLVRHGLSLWLVGFFLTGFFIHA
jgi:adenosylcobinamide-phosphate synthase